MVGRAKKNFTFDKRIFVDVPHTFKFGSHKECSDRVKELQS